MLLRKDPASPELWERLNLMSADEVTDFITGHLYPRTLNASRTVGGKVFSMIIARRDDLTDVHAQAFLTTHLSYVVQDQRSFKHSYRGPHLDEAMMNLLPMGNISLAMMGTLVRSLSRASWSKQGVMEMELKDRLLVAPDCPLEVKARLLARLGSTVSGMTWTDEGAPFAARNFHRLVPGRWSELADLPAQLQCELVASFPIPEEWFLDVVPAPEPQDGDRGRMRVHATSILDDLLSSSAEEAVE